MKNLKLWQKSFFKLLYILLLFLFTCSTGKQITECPDNKVKYCFGINCSYKVCDKSVDTDNNL